MVAQKNYIRVCLEVDRNDSRGKKNLMVTTRLILQC